MKRLLLLVLPAAFAACSTMPTGSDVAKVANKPSFSGHGGNSEMVCSDASGAAAQLPPWAITTHNFWAAPIPPGDWVGPIATSNTDYPRLSTNTYVTSVSLPSDAINIALTGTVLADNDVLIKINGVNSFSTFDPTFVVLDPRPGYVANFPNGPANPTMPNFETSGGLPFGNVAVLPPSFNVTFQIFNDDNPNDAAHGFNPYGLAFCYTVTYDIGTPPPNPDLSIIKTGPGTAALGDQVTYTITATNNGPPTATNVVVTDTLPTGAAFVSASDGGTLVGNVITWPTVASMLLGAQVSHTVTVTYAATGTYTNIDAVTGDKPDPTPDNNRAMAQTDVQAPPATCVLGYPYSSANPLTNTDFNESEVLGAWGRNGNSIMLWAVDEHAMTLGAQDATHPVTDMVGNPASALNPTVGNKAMTDPSGRPLFPALFVTDLTTNGSGSTKGDWQQGGSALSPNAVYGTWKDAIVATVTKKGVTTTTITPGADPSKKNNLNVGAGQAVPVGVANQGFSASVVWNLTAIPGFDPSHNYRLQFMVHDGDQNKTGGDVGEACFNVGPGTPTNFTTVAPPVKK